MLLTRTSAPTVCLELLALTAMHAPEVLPELVAKEEFSLDDEPMLSALILLHARACSIAWEVVSLLRSGYADGGQARSRTLHEIAVVSFFLADGGDDLARRYLLHDTVESWRAAEQYEAYRARLGYAPLSAEELAKLENDYQDLLTEYGKSYGHQYRWAAEALATSNPRFADIERAMGMDHHRGLVTSRQATPPTPTRREFSSG